MNVHDADRILRRRGAWEASPEEQEEATREVWEAFRQKRDDLVKQRIEATYFEQKVALSLALFACELNLAGLRRDHSGYSDLIRDFLPVAVELARDGDA